jgi:hypothetical protein
VRQDHRRRIAGQGALDHLTRVHAGLADGAGEQRVQADQPVLVVEKQHGKHLVLQPAQVQLQVILDHLRRIEHRRVGQPLGQRPAGHLDHRRQFGPLGRAQALDALQIIGAGLQQAGIAAHAGQHAFGQLQHALAAQAGAQQQRQQFGVGQAGGAVLQQLFTRAGGNRQILDRHGGVVQERQGRGGPGPIECRMSLCPPARRAL